MVTKLPAPMPLHFGLGTWRDVSMQTAMQIVLTLHQCPLAKIYEDRAGTQSRRVLLWLEFSARGVEQTLRNTGTLAIDPFTWSKTSIVDSHKEALLLVTTSLVTCGLLDPLVAVLWLEENVS